MTASPPAPPILLFARLALITCGLLTLRARPAAAQSIQPAPATQPNRPTLLAYGSSDQYWIANVEPYRDGAKTRFKTLIRQQTLPAGDWKELGAVYGHAAALAEMQGELALLLDDSSWKRVGEGGLTTGPSVPGAGAVLAWGSTASTLYAIRAVEGGKEGVTTRPVEPAALPATRVAATQTAASATSKPTTRPLDLALLRYEKGQWVGVADLPASANTAAAFSLASAGNKPLLAFSADGSAIRTFALVDSKWEDWGEVRPGGRASGFGLLTAGHAAALWTADPDGGMKLFLKREAEPWTPAKAFNLPVVPAGAQRALAAAGEEFRLVFLKDGKFWEQRYDRSGALFGSLTEMPVPQTNRPDPIIRILYSVMLLGMVIVMLVTFYRRRAAATTAEKKDEE
jgi:hypothetical protein